MSGNAVRSLYRAVRPRPKPHAVVLMYHRVAECDIDPWNLCVSPQQFADQIAALKREHCILPLQELIRSDARRNAVAITFDDGYADNLHAAAPVLEHHRAPACFFLTSGALDMAHEFWWDELERLLLRESALPSTMTISVGRQAPVRARARRRAGKGLARPDSRQPALESRPEHPAWFLLFGVAGLAGAGRAGSSNRAGRDRAAVGGGLGNSRQPPHFDQPMEAQRLAAIPGIEIGAHSVTHAVLPSLEPEAQSREIGDAKRASREAAWPAHHGICVSFRRLRRRNGGSRARGRIRTCLHDRNWRSHPEDRPLPAAATRLSRNATVSSSFAGSTNILG